MTEINKTVFKKMLTALMTVILVMSVFVSLVYVIEEADHECSGNDCPVCMTLSICRRNIQGIVTITAVGVILIFTLHTVLQSCIICTAENNGLSLIRQKIRMNN